MFERNRKIVDSIEGLSADEKEFLYSALNMHGHICGGMPMGYVAGIAALKALGVEREKNMEKIVIVNVGDKHAAGCFADGVQFATGCTFGKGVMKKEPKGKWVITLIDKKTEKAVKVRVKYELLKKAFSAPFIQEYRIKGVKPTDVPPEVAEPGFKNMFKMKLEDIVEVGEPFDYKIPKGKACFNLIQCESCGDAVAENYVKIEDGKKVCMDCSKY